MRSTIINNLQARMTAYDDLLAQTDANALEETIDVPKHKSLKEHLWCVVGARESYAKALAADGWQGFNCSMTTFEVQDFELALASSRASVISTLQAIDDWTPAREALLGTLAEHEVMHEGQIIRHLYAVGRNAPTSWKWA